jgi:hypothetical protein
MDVDGEAQELVDDTSAGEHLERGGFDRRSPGLMVRLRLTIHDPGADAAGTEEPGGPPADNENVLHDASFLVPDAGWPTNLIQLKAIRHITRPGLLQGFVRPRALLTNSTTPSAS